MGNTTHPRKAHYFAYQLNSKAKSTLATYRCLAFISSKDGNAFFFTVFLMGSLMIILVDVSSKIHCHSSNIKSHSFIIPLCYLGSKRPDSLLSVASRFFHKFLVVAFTNTTIKNDGITEKFYLKNKFGNTMELGHSPSLTLFVAVFVPSREACME
jgi:hypothetical protein